MINTDRTMILNQGNSYIKNSYIETRQGDNPFKVVHGEQQIQLDGYAIIPIEKYRELENKIQDDADTVKD